MKKPDKTAIKLQQSPSIEERKAALRKIIAQDEALLVTYPRDKNLKADLANLQRNLQELEQPQEQPRSI